MTLRELRLHRELSLLDVERLTGIHRGTQSRESATSCSVLGSSRPRSIFENKVDPSEWRATVVFLHPNVDGDTGGDAAA